VSATSALVVVDLQTDFCHPKGVFAENGMTINDEKRTSLIRAINDMTEFARANGVPVIRVRMTWDKKTDLGLSVARVEAPGALSCWKASPASLKIGPSKRRASVGSLRQIWNSACAQWGSTGWSSAACVPTSALNQRSATLTSATLTSGCRPKLLAVTSRYA
jgi:nicotinamidase-related amidase